MGKIFSKILIYTVLIAAAVFALFPLIYTVASSFKTNSEILAYPARIFSKNPTFENYIIAFKSKDFNIGRMTWNSTYYTAICVVIMLLSSSLGGYVFARGDFPGRRLFLSLFPH